MSKFYKGQLVILARPERTLNMKGAIGEVVALPGEMSGVYPDGKKWKRTKFPERYLVHYPGYPWHENGRAYYNSAEHMLDPLIQGEDNRTAEDESRLIFDPKKAKV